MSDEIHGHVVAFDGRRIEARLIGPDGEEYSATIPLRKFPLTAREIKPGVIFIIDGSGIRLPPRLTARDILQSNKRADTLAALFKGSVE
ncbi:MAG: hypothetical protein AB7J28_15475 [Hyphomonadaceae bacterium]